MPVIIIIMETEAAMSKLMLDGIEAVVARRARLFFEDIIHTSSELIHSIHLTGSSLTEDFDSKTSDINSVIVLNEMDLGFLEALAPKGKKYRKSGISSPLIMTPDYIQNSLDVFPIEFLNIRLCHHTVLGDDIFRDIVINRDDLRHQCEREIKVKLIGIRQGYLSSMGNSRTLAENFSASITGHIPLFRGLIELKGAAPPLPAHQVIDALSESTQVDCSAFREVLSAKRGGVKKGSLDTLFERYYKATEQIKKVIDEISA